jgi:signal transduction histidine kinase
MKLFSKPQGILSPLVMAMLAVLIILAVLQYRWSMQVGEANEAQIGANLQALLMDWHMDLFREFSGIAIALQVGPDSGARDDWPDYLDRYAEWARTADHPDLIENVYVYETAEAGERELIRLDLDSKKLGEVDPPAKLTRVLARLSSESQNLPIALHAWMLSDPRMPMPISPGPNRPDRHTDSMTGWQFEQGIPALVHPIVHHPHNHDSEEYTSPKAVDWIIVCFNSSVLANDVFPDLSRRYFGSTDHLDYKVAVITGDADRRALYSSDAGYGMANVNTSDVMMNIFGSPPESTEGALWQTVRNGNMLSRRDWRRFTGPVWFPVIRYSAQDANNEGGWKLILNHRQGSLESILGGLHRRNLAISYGVLLLLAISLGLVIVATHRAQNLARLQMDFIATVSHELRTPLSVLASAAENITDRVVEDKPQLIKYGSVIRQQTRQLSELVEQILAFAASREPRSRYVLRRLPVAEIIETAVNNTAGLLEAAGVVLEEQLQPGLPEVVGDLAGLSQCIQNLIGNAVKYGGHNRWIGLRAKVSSNGTESKEVQITVEDHGLGIDSAEIEHIFEPFYRSPAVHEAQIRGTGLGLPLAKTIAEAMGGRITVSSQVGKGSAFTLHLPVAEDAAAGPQVLRGMSELKH